MTTVCAKCGKEKLWMDIAPRPWYSDPKYFCERCDDLDKARKLGRKLMKLHPDKRTERSGYSYKEQLRSSDEPLPKWEKERLVSKKTKNENKRNVLETIKEDVSYDGDDSEEQ